MKSKRYKRYRQYSWEIECGDRHAEDWIFKTHRSDGPAQFLFDDNWDFLRSFYFFYDHLAPPV